MYVARFSLSRGFGSSFVPSQRRGRSHVYIERGLNGDIIRSQHLHALPAPQYKRGRERKGNSAVQCSSWLGPLFFPNILDKNTSLLLVRVFQPPLTQREMPSWNPRVWKGKSSFFSPFLCMLTSSLLYHCRCLVYYDPLRVWTHPRIEWKQNWTCLVLECISIKNKTMGDPCWTSLKTIHIAAQTGEILKKRPSCFFIWSTVDEITSFLVLFLHFFIGFYLKKGGRGVNM